eukprot:c8454_g1_i2.p1 GENE.c8454_g1_i2~~c8454_g1_i2.p1  ORF type:complete len:540 (-),score=161.93 c8454_g1_i2:3-1508(-)
MSMRHQSLQPIAGSPVFVAANQISDDTPAIDVDATKVLETTTCEGKCANRMAYDKNAMYYIAATGGFVLLVLGTALGAFEVIGVRSYFKLVVASLGLGQSPLPRVGDETKPRVPPKANSDYTTELIRFIHSPPNDFKINMVGLLVGVGMFTVRYLEEHNGVDALIANVVVSHVLTAFVTLFADLIVTGRMRFSDIKDPKFLKENVLVIGMFLVTVSFNIGLTTSITLFLTDMIGSLDAHIAIQCSALLAMVIGFVSQLFVMTFLREHWAYRKKLFSQKHIPSIKSMAVLVVALLSIAYFATLLVQYQQSVSGKLCNSFWNKLKGSSVCGVYSNVRLRLPMLTCATFCKSDSYADEGVCVQLNWAKDNCPNGLTRNLFFDVGAAGIFLFFLFMITVPSSIGFSAWATDPNAEAEEELESPAGEADKNDSTENGGKVSTTSTTAEGGEKSGSTPKRDAEALAKEAELNEIEMDIEKARKLLQVKGKSSDNDKENQSVKPTGTP